MVGYLPKQRDLIWLDFDPQAGREQAGRRPALVISVTAYNQKTGLAVVCPVTNQAKGYPFEVVVPNGLKASGVILVDHIKSADWKKRNASFIDTFPKAQFDLVLETLNMLF